MILYRYFAYEWSFWFITRYKSYIIADIKRNREVNILLQLKIQGFTSKKTNRKCLLLTKYTENTGPEIIFYGFRKKKNEIGKNQSNDPVEQDINLVWPYVKLIYYHIFDENKFTSNTSFKNIGDTRIGQIEEISIFSNSIHIEWRMGLSDSIWKRTHSRTIPFRFGLTLFNGFRGEDLNGKA